MARPKRRRRKRSRSLPKFVLFGLGLGCIVAAGAIWLLSPDATPAAGAPVAGQSAEPVAAVPAAAPVAADPAAAPPAGEAPPPPVATAAPQTPATASAAEAPATAPIAVPTPAGEPSPAKGETNSTGRPRLAIIIDDCGQWPVTERAFVALDFPLTLSVLPHVRYGPVIAREAETAGKGVMLHLPMQTISGRYPGPGTITISMNDDAIRSEVAGDLAELPEARGVNNHEGSLATSDRRVMGDVADVLVRENRFWIDSKTSARSIAANVTRERGIPTASRDVFLDDVDDQTAIEAQLREAAADARQDGTAIAIGHPREATLAAVRTLAPELMAQGIDFTLASNLVH